MTTFLLRCLAPGLLALHGLCGTPALAASDFLTPEEAFRFEARALDTHHIEVVFQVAEGYYLYRERFAFAVAPATVQLGAPVIPPGKIKFDETFGKKLETHRGRVVIRLPVVSAAKSLVLTVNSQGCADAGLCYAPMQSTARLSLTQPSLKTGR